MYPEKTSFVCEVLSFCCFCVAGFVSFFCLLYFPATASSPSGGGAFFVLEMAVKVMILRSGIQMNWRRLLFEGCFFRSVEVVM